MKITSNKAETTTALANMERGLEECGITHLLIVPSSHLDPVYEVYRKKDRCYILTKEEEAAAFSSGLVMSGQRPAMLIQQSGVGNMLNFVWTLAEPFGLYFPILVFDRGTQDPNIVQHFSSNGTRKALKNLGSVDIDWENSDSPKTLKSFIEARTVWILFSL